MLLIDAIYINDGGGKILLDYLIENLEKAEVKCVYLFDSRIENNHPNIKSTNHVVYLKSSLWRRFRFYSKYKTSFTRVFCMGNIPPNVKMRGEVITYFHSMLYLKTPKDFPLLEQFKYILKRHVLKTLEANTSHWLVQTELMKQKLEEKFHIDESRVSLMPFFPPFDNSYKQIHRENYSFIYVSNATNHKNHRRLIDAFCAFFDEHKMGKLILTVSKEYMQVTEIIEKKTAEGYPIVNVGLVCREQLQVLYLSSQYLIFPSVSESFGLGLVEAINNGCKVIASDLAYTYAVCKPSIVFNPYKVESIIRAFKLAVYKESEMSKSLISDEMESLIKLLLTRQRNS